MKQAIIDKIFPHFAEADAKAEKAFMDKWVLKHKDDEAKRPLEQPPAPPPKRSRSTSSLPDVKKPKKEKPKAQKDKMDLDFGLMAAEGW